MFTDSHCHLNFPELRSQLPQILADMQAAQVDRALCICCTLDEFESVHQLALEHPNLWSTVGVHPDYEDTPEPTVDDLVRRSALPRVVGIGETGLDYYRLDGRSVSDMAWQRERFRVHIQAVFHCFTETQAVARAALDLGFYISLSGIVTFKNATELRDVARLVPMDRLLIETDSPYLAPAPHRGKTNTPAFVPLVAQQIAEVKGVSVEAIAQATSENFERLFDRVRPT
jgi:TatD DNase family protein